MRYKALAALAALPFLMAQSSPSMFGVSHFDGADPDWNVFDGVYWIYTTSGRAYSSTDGKTWRLSGRSTDGKVLAIADVPWADVGDGRPRGLWAPDMVKIGDEYYFYFAVGPNEGVPSRVGVARCGTSPAGPCVATSRPLYAPTEFGHEAIDPDYFIDGNTGKAYLYTGGSSHAAGKGLRIFEMTSPTQLGRQIKAPNSSEAYQPDYFTEAPHMHSRMQDGRALYYLTFSEGNWKTNEYQVRYVVSDTPYGPWRKLESDNVLVKSEGGSQPFRIRGPGHQSIIRNPSSGRWSMAYHRYDGDPNNVPRRTAIARITYAANGSINPIDMRDQTPDD